jgi:flagellar assembly protein FliH
MAPQRFTFDRAFPETPDRVVPIEKKEPTITVLEHEKLLAMTAAAARQEGFTAGKAEAEDEFTAQLARAMEQVAVAMELLRGDLDGIRDIASDEAIRIGNGVAVKLAGRLMDDAPMALIEDEARRIFEDLRGQPHVAVRVADGLLEATRERMQAVAREKGFEGRLIVMGEPEIASGDVRIEWADGGIVRDRPSAAHWLPVAPIRLKRREWRDGERLEPA